MLPLHRGLQLQQERRRGVGRGAGRGREGQVEMGKTLSLLIVLLQLRKFRAGEVPARPRFRPSDHRKILHLINIQIFAVDTPLVLDLRGGKKS